MNTPKTEIWCDAAVVGGPARRRYQSTLHGKHRAGWAYVVLCGETEEDVLKCDSGRYEGPMKMDSIDVELEAVIQASRSAYAPYSIIHTDCKHVARLANGERIKGHDLKKVIKLRDRLREIGAKVQWSEGHNGGLGQTKADSLARDAIGLAPAMAWGVS